MEEKKKETTRRTEVVLGTQRGEKEYIYECTTRARVHKHQGSRLSKGGRGGGLMGDRPGTDDGAPRVDYEQEYGRARWW